MHQAAAAIDRTARAAGQALVAGASLVTGLAIATCIALAACIPGSAAWAAPPVASDDCSAVTSALALARARTAVRVRSELRSGRHPDGWQTREAWRDGAATGLAIDGHAYRAAAFDEHALFAGLAPDGDCTPLDAPPPAGARQATGWTYMGGDPVDGGALAARAGSRIRLWIAADSGLPVLAEIDAPELEYGRVLSRPGTAPQVTLRPSGRRYLEWRRFQWPAPSQG